MKKIILSLLILYSTAGIAGAPSLSAVRLLYQQAATKEKYCKELITLLSPYNEKNNPLLMGYKAGGTMMMAKYVFNPISKFSYFKKGKKMLEMAIDANENNVELRFLRFTFQTNVPSFLDYRDKIETDKIFILNSISQLTYTALKNLIISHLKNSDYLTNTEKKRLNDERIIDTGR
jgi:hypothetical protein